MHRFLPLILIVLGFFLLNSPQWLIAAHPADQTEWTDAYEALPAGGDPVSEGDDNFRQMKQAVRDRLEASFDFGDEDACDAGMGDATCAGIDTGRMLEGAARIYYEDTAPVELTGRVRDGYDNGTGNTGLGVVCEGALHRDGDDGGLYVMDDSGECTLAASTAGSWVQAITQFTDDIDLSSMSWLKSAVGMDIHDHGQRHVDITTAAGAEGTDYDVIDNIIQSITTATPVDIAPIPNADLEQTLATIDLGDLTARRSASQFLIYCRANFENGQGGTRQVDLFICPEDTDTCNNTTSIDGYARHDITDGSGSDEVNIDIWVYADSVTNTVSTEFTCRLELSVAAASSNITEIFMMIVDLGLT